MPRLPLALVAAALAAALALVAGQGIGHDVCQGAEAREALVKREMVRSGDWVLPRWNGVEIPSKPPLHHWLVATGAALRGTDVTEAGLRAPSLVLAAATVALVVVVIGRIAGPLAGALAGVVLVTTPQVLAEAGNGRVDATRCAAITAALLAWLVQLRRERPSWALRLALGAALGCAALAKGPVGPGLVGLGAVALALAERRADALRPFFHPLTLAVAALVATSWYLAAWHAEGWAFVSKQLLSENGEALLGGERIPDRSFAFYLSRLVLGGLPWMLLLPWAVPAAWRGARERRALLLFAAAAMAFLSVVPLKRGAYLLPVRPALAIVVGWWLADVATAGVAAPRLRRAQRRRRHPVDVLRRAPRARATGAGARAAGPTGRVLRARPVALGALGRAARLARGRTQRTPLLQPTGATWFSCSAPATPRRTTSRAEPRPPAAAHATGGFGAPTAYCTRSLANSRSSVQSSITRSFFSARGSLTR